MISFLHKFARAIPLIALPLLAGVSGCSQERLPSESAPRIVKIETIASSDATSMESFVGTLRARSRADLGFESAGRIAAILVDVGDRVHAGQTLARVDAGPSNWNVEKAEADRAAAAVALANQETSLTQSEGLARDDIISPVALQAVRTQRDQAASQLKAAEAALALARHGATASTISAPYDGQIVGRLAQPHGDIGSGQPVLQIEATDVLEAVVMLPEVVATQLAIGSRAHALAGAGVTSSDVRLVLERLSAHSDSGSLVQAIFRAEAPARGARTGQVVSIEVPKRALRSISVPASAVMPGSDRGTGSVFVLAGGHLVRRAIKLGDVLLPGGRIAVASGLSTGDQVVVAGTHLLSEGQLAVKQQNETILQESGS